MDIAGTTEIINNVSHEAFVHCLTDGDWRGLLYILTEVMAVWRNSFSDCVFDETMLRVASEEASRL
jgi:hypothetical protein